MYISCKIRKFLLAAAFLAIAVFLQNTMNAEAAGKLSSDVSKLWLNGNGTLKVHYQDHSSEELSVSAKASGSVRIEIGEWEGDTCVIKLTPRKDKNTTLTISAGGEQISVKLYMLKEKKRSGEDIYSYLKKAMVEFRCTDSYGQVYIGSGFFVGEGLVMTNLHVTDSASEITITDYFGKTYPIKKIYGIDEDRDLILFSVSGTGKAALSFADSFSGGEKIYNIGSPAGITGSFVSGVLANDGYPVGGVNFIQLSMPTGIGAGGGPIVNEKGQVIGIMTLVVNVAQNITLAVDSTEMSAFMNSLTSKDRINLSDYYKTTANKIKGSNDYRIFDGFSDENTTAASRKVKPVMSAEEIFKAASDAMVDIQIIYNVLGSSVAGSGFFISEDTIVTNCHVMELEIARKTFITDYSGNQYYLTEPVRKSEKYDVAILKVAPEQPDTTHGILETASGYIPATGETVYAMGSPAGFSSTFSDGIVAMSVRTMEGVDYIHISLPITGGSSGGPLMNKYGEVIGINSRIINVVENSNLAVYIKYLSEAE